MITGKHRRRTDVGCTCTVYCRVTRQPLSCEYGKPREQVLTASIKNLMLRMEELITQPYQNAVAASAPPLPAFSSASSTPHLLLTTASNFNIFTHLAHPATTNMANTSKSDRLLKCKGKSSASEPHPSTNPPSPPLTVSDLRKDPAIWYRVLLLIHDLQNFKHDTSSRNRLDETTHERYLSAPYFATDEDVAKVRGALTEDEGVTVDEAITKRLEGFLEKRRASGDMRPCGPHDLGPVFMECFGVEKGETAGEGFF